MRPLLYKSVMHSYQQANNADKMLAMSQKILTFDPDDPDALLGVAQVLAERTRETDVDKDQRLAKRGRMHNVRWSPWTPIFLPRTNRRRRSTAYKGFLRSEAYEIIGTLDFNAKDWADAEGQSEEVD